MLGRKCNSRPKRFQPLEEYSGLDGSHTKLEISYLIVNSAIGITQARHFAIKT